MFSFEEFDFDGVEAEFRCYDKGWKSMEELRSEWWETLPEGITGRSRGLGL